MFIDSHISVVAITLKGYLKGHSRIGLEYNNNGAGDGEQTVGSTVGYVHGGVLSTVGQGHVEIYR